MRLVINYSGRFAGKFIVKLLQLGIPDPNKHKYEYSNSANNLDMFISHSLMFMELQFLVIFHSPKLCIMSKFLMKEQDFGTHESWN